MRAVRWMLIVGLAALSVPAEAMTRKEFLQKTFKGFTSVGVYCTISPSTAWADNLCEAVVQKVRLVGASARVKVERLDNKVFERFLFLRGNPGVLPVEVAIRNNTAPISAAWVRIAATLSLDEIPRPGDFLLWERDVIGGGGSVTELEVAMRSNAETIVNAFFADLLVGTRD